MSRAVPPSGPVAGSAAAEAAARRALRRGRIAGRLMAAVLLGFGVFTVWSSEATSLAAARGTAAVTRSDHYREAAYQVVLQDGLMHEYQVHKRGARLVQIRIEFQEASEQVVANLQAVYAEGGPADRRLAETALASHAEFTAAVSRLFAAVDGNDPGETTRLDRTEVDPPFDTLNTLVSDAARTQVATSNAQLTELKHQESLYRHLTPLAFGATVGLLAALAAVSRGQARLLAAERAQAVHASLHDGLTGLANRTLFTDRVEHALRTADRDGSHLSVLLIDLDRFKEINDTFGHHYGDALLIEVGTRITRALRGVDTVARLGGDEFAVLLPGVATTQDAARVAQKLIDALEQPFAVLGVDLDVEASIGVVHSGDAGFDFDTLLQRADTAMYAAKTRGQGVSIYQAGSDAQSPATLTLLGDLRRALDRDELFLHLQPKLAIDPTAADHVGEVVGVEALLRWKHPEKGMVPPDAFIPLAEHTGLIGPLTRYVLERAIIWAKDRQENGDPVPVAVNLSARNLLDDRLPHDVAGLLARHDLPAGLLHLEVTESAIVTEQARAVRLLHELTGLGIRISIDDFGAGYTSLGQLRDLPVHELKIDRSFVQGMAENPANTTIVRSVIELGHNLGLSIVAEGVETAETLAELASYGCDVAQGYLFTPPLAPDAYAGWHPHQAKAAVANPDAT